MNIKNLVFILFVTSCAGVKEITPVSSSPAVLVAEKKIEIDYSPSNKVNPSFVDVSKEVGLDKFYSVRNYVVDLDSDGDEDIVILPEEFSTPIFLLSTKNGFVQAKNIFFATPVKASFLNFHDFNKDGIIDVLVAVHNQKTELSKRPLQVFLGSKFRENLIFKLDETYNFEKKSPVSSVAILDYDQDGQIDFFVANWFDRTNPSQARLVPDNLYTYKNKKIYNVSKALIDEDTRKDDIFINAMPSFGASHCDLNSDGLVDILVTNSAGLGNKLWLGEKNKNIFSFRNVGLKSQFFGDNEGNALQYGNGNSTYSVCNDYNNDTIFDIALGEVTHAYEGESRDRSSILSGEGLSHIPTFIRTDYTSDDGRSNWNQGDRRGVWLDYNGDGLLDLLVENSGFPPDSRLILFSQYEDHSYEDLSKKLGLDIVNPAGSVVFDYNGDGKQDILVSQLSTRDSRIEKRLFLFENKVQTKNKILKISLKTKRSNSSAIGAVVTVYTADKKIQTRYHQLNYGPFPSQNSRYLHIGIGSSKVEKIEVSWPHLKSKKSVFPVGTFFIDSRGVIELSET